MTKKKILTILFTTLLFSYLNSQEVKEISLEECIQLALSENHSLLQSGITLKTAQRKVNNNWSYFLPDLTAAASSTYFSDPLPNQDNPTMTGSITARFDLTSSLPFTIRANYLALQNEEISMEQAERNLKDLVERSFYQLIAQEQSLQIKRENLILAGKEYAKTLSDYDNGRIALLSVMQAQVSYESLKPQFSNDQKNYQNNIRTFLNTLGLELNTKIKLLGDLDISPLKELKAEEIIENFIYTRKDIQQAITQLDMEKNSHLLTLTQKRLPSLYLSAGWKTGDFLDQDTFQNDSLRGSGSLTLGVSVPLDNFVPGSQDDLAVKASKDRIDSKELALEKTIANAKLEIYNLVDTLNNLAETLSVSELNVELSQTNYDMSEEGYQLGTIEQLDLENARLNYLKAKQNLLDNQYQYMAAEIDLLKALNITERDQL
jgi:multidrug efflux system outer membrane protein